MIYRRDGLMVIKECLSTLKISLHRKYNIMATRLANGDDVKVVYSEPWFWKCSVSRVPKPKK